MGCARSHSAEHIHSRQNSVECLYQKEEGDTDEVKKAAGSGFEISQDDVLQIPITTVQILQPKVEDIDLSQHERFVNIPPVVGSGSQLNKDDIDLTQHERRLAQASPQPFTVLGDETIFSSSKFDGDNTTSEHFHIMYAGDSLKGIQNSNSSKPNQDQILFIKDHFSNTFVFACLDGHGQNGHTVAAFCKNYLEKNLCLHPSFVLDIKSAILGTIAALDRELNANKEFDLSFSGTTLILIAFRDNRAIVACIGDSRVVMGKQPISAIEGVQVKQISTDHKPSLPNEYVRIVSCGGRVMIPPNGAARVYLPSIDVPGLAMSRSLGDAQVHAVGVSSIPEIFEVDLTENILFSPTPSDLSENSGVNDDIMHDMMKSNGDGQSKKHAVELCFVVGTDGLFDVMSNSEIVAACLIKEKDEPKTPAAVVDNLISCCKDRWINTWGIMDDTTIIVIKCALNASSNLKAGNHEEIRSHHDACSSNC